MIPISDPKLYFIKSGSLELFHQIGTRQLPFKILRSGGSFGFHEFITENPIKFKARALTSVSLLQFDRNHFIQNLSKNTKDFEVFCMIRDGIMLSENATCANIKTNCTFGKIPNYEFEAYLRRSLYGDKSEILDRYLKSFIHNQPRKAFKRNERNKFNALGNFSLIQQVKFNREKSISEALIRGNAEEGSFDYESSCEGYCEKEESLNPNKISKKMHKHVELNCSFERGNNFDWYFHQNNLANVLIAINNSPWIIENSLKNKSEMGKNNG